MTERLKKLIEWLKKKNYDNWQVFYSRNWVGDPMNHIYCQDGIQVDACYKWDYLEIFGLTKEEKDILCSKGEDLKLNKF